MTSEEGLMVDIDAIGKELAEYEKLNFGVKYGPDFLEVARALVNAEQFPMKVFLAMALTAITSKSQFEKLDMKNVKEGETKTRIRDAMRGSSLETTLVEMFYWGFITGKRQAEVEQLDRLHKQE